MSRSATCNVNELSENDIHNTNLICDAMVRLGYEPRLPRWDTPCHSGGARVPL